MEVTAKTTTFQKYPAYKDTGVEWLGEIPEHWKAIRIKHLFKEINERSFDGSEDLLSVSQYTGVTNKSERLEDGGMLTSAFTLEGYKKVKINDLVSNIMLAWNGSLGFSNYNGITSPAYSIYRLKSNNVTRYFHYLFRTELYKSEFKRNSSGVIESRLRLYTDDFFRIESILPPIKEQTSIAAFLDNKTAKIERAIAQKEKMMALLKERKQIIIQDAVTKGLNPNAKMKHSGVEWIGEIPEYWEVSKAKFYSKIFVPERTKPELDEDFHSGIPWITTDLLGKDYLDIQKAKYFVNSKNARIAGSRIVKNESVLATCVGNFGIASINSFDCIINQQIQGYTQIKLNPMYFIQIVRLSKDFFSNNSTMTTIQYVSKDTFGDLPILIPTIQEQTAIVAHIETQSAKIDKAIGLQEQQIEKLKELKATLIDGAVTGKIKVC